MKKAKNIDEYDLEELACYVTELEFKDFEDGTEIETELLDKFGCNFEQFTDLIRILLPIIDVGTSPLTGKRYKGFSDNEKGIWLAKTEIE